LIKRNNGFLTDFGILNKLGTWAMIEMDMKRLSIWERKILRSIYGRVAEQRNGE